MMSAAARHSSASQVLPWEIYPALTAERVRLCTRLLTNGRHDAVRLASPGLDFNSWPLGCHAYAFGKQRLQSTAESQTHSSLTVLDQSHYFVFLNAPVRFLRGVADEPTARTLRRQVIEAEQLTLALGKEQAESLLFRMALKAEASSDLQCVVLLEAAYGRVTFFEKHSMLRVAGREQLLF